ncbi:MAG: hypothetical protein GX620_04635 [Chloroflexi bacterium]|nr:hypothetical protein [Chloroflexota bacterium]
MRVPFSWIVCSALLLTGVGPTSRAQAGLGLVTGQVVNLTPGGEAPVDLEVELHGFRDGEEVLVLGSSVGSDGVFRFEGLDTTGDVDLIARTVYQDVAYHSPVARLAPGIHELNLPITIYEVTDDPSSIRIEVLHLFVSLDGDRLRIAEYHQLGNDGDRTYAGMSVDDGVRTTLTVKLPDGASSLQFDPAAADGRFQRRDGAFVDTRPIVPGASTLEVVFSYELPYRVGETVERVYGLPVDVIRIMALDEGLSIQGAGVVAGSVVDSEMGPVRSFGAGPLLAGERLAFLVVSRGSATQAPVSDGVGRGDAALGLAALMLALVAVYLLWRPGDIATPPVWAREIVSEMADLDVALIAGRMSVEDHRLQREELTGQLRRLIQERRDD